MTLYHSCYYGAMTAVEIEALPEVRQAAEVLRGLEELGLIEPAIASGWTRGFLTDTASNDIDVAYVGPVPYTEAQQHLRTVLAQLGADPAPWDIEGIWNAQQAYGLEHTVDNYLIYYVCSVDSVFLAADGKLHDPTGHGFADAQAGILRINQYDQQDGRIPTPYEEVNVCLEGCRRIMRLNWEPTPESAQRMVEGVIEWGKLTSDDKTYFIRKLRSKFKPAEYQNSRAIYDQFGWGFIFDQL